MRAEHIAINFAYASSMPHYLWQIICQIVVIALVFHVDVLDSLKPCWLVQSPGHDADMIPGFGKPEQARTATTAEPAGREFRGGEPFEAFVGDYRERILRHSGSSDKVAAGTPALSAVAIHDGS